jgi:transposase-like protein
MRKISYAGISYVGYRFPPEIIHQAIWLYLRFTLSYRDVEDLLAECGILISYGEALLEASRWEQIPPKMAYSWRV